MDGVCWLSTVKKILSVWKVHLKHHLSPAYLYCGGKEGWLAWIHAHPYCLRLAAPPQPEGSWSYPQQSWEEGKHVSGVGSWDQCSAGFPTSKLEGARAQAWVLPCGCPCCWVVSRLPGLDQALPAGVFPSSAPGSSAQGQPLALFRRQHKPGLVFSRQYGRDCPDLEEESLIIRSQGVPCRWPSELENGFKPVWFISVIYSLVTLMWYFV